MNFCSCRFDNKKAKVFHDKYLDFNVSVLFVNNQIMFKCKTIFHITSITREAAFWGDFKFSHRV